MFQSSTRLTGFATFRIRSPPGTERTVSILYEANRLCDEAGRLPSEADREVSILYEANRLCDSVRVLRSKASPTLFQSSTRLTGFATDLRAGTSSAPPVVSILYEANRLCDAGLRVYGPGAETVSILYEANRLCDSLASAGRDESEVEFQSSTRLTGFATAGATVHEVSADRRGFQSSTRLTGFATRPRSPERSEISMFQSSTRLTGFATWPLQARTPGGVHGFNPLRG